MSRCDAQYQGQLRNVHVNCAMSKIVIQGQVFHPSCMLETKCIGTGREAINFCSQKVRMPIGWIGIVALHKSQGSALPPSAVSECNQQRVL